MPLGTLRLRRMKSVVKADTEIMALKCENDDREFKSQCLEHFCFKKKNFDGDSIASERQLGPRSSCWFFKVSQLKK